MIRLALTVVAAGLALALPASSPARAPSLPPSISPSPQFVADALCVHAGRTFTPGWVRGSPAVYALFGRVYRLRHPDYDDVVSGPAPNGEANWSDAGSFGGGMQFMVGTWNRAADLSGGILPHVRYTAEIGNRPVWEQVLAAWLIVRQDGGSWGEWPNTSRSCGLR